MFRLAILLVTLILPISAMAQSTNLSVAWRICEQHGKMIGRASPLGPARWIFDQRYGSCEAIQKLVPSMKSEELDPNKFMSDQMLIERALRNPVGDPAKP